MKGNSIVYDHYNFPSKTTDASLSYRFENYTDPKNTVIKIAFQQIGAGDTLTVDNTRLTMDGKGMTWWGVDKQNNFDDSHKTLALSLPLYKGKNWKTYMNDRPVQSACITTDTSITCPMGTYSCFGTRTIMPVQETKEYTMYIQLDEYFSNEIGRVMKVTTQYVYLKKARRTTRVYEEILFTTRAAFKKP